jgi:FkbM family methyltransferase
MRPTGETVFGFRVNFFDYRVFTSLFKQMFITREYYFQSKTENPFIIDCGSNIGMSVLFFKWLYPESTVLAFEPDRATFNLLEKNVRGNNLKNVEIFNKAVSDSDGTIEFYSNPNNPGALTMSIYSTWNPEKIAYKVDTVKLSRHITKTVDFLKMDIEGAEVMVIGELAKNGKLRFIREMVMEYHHHMEPSRDLLGKMLATLEENGFGYQMQTALKPPFRKEQYQNLIIYAYQKDMAGRQNEK